MSGYCAEKAAVPIEEALMAFAEVDISGVENFFYRTASSFYSRQSFKGTKDRRKGDSVPGRLHAGQQGKICNWCPFCRGKTGNFSWTV